MTPSLASVFGKANAFVEVLSKLPRSARATVPRGHFARDYNTLRSLALEAMPSLDERLIGKFVGVFAESDCEYSQASFAEIEVYSRQILEQLQLFMSSTARNDLPKQPVSFETQPLALVTPSKTFSVAEVRKDFGQAYMPWNSEDDEYLRSRFGEGASIEELTEEFARNSGAIRSRLRKLGLLK